MDLQELYEYKNLLMEDICSDPDIVKAVTNNKNADVPNHVLPYTQVFPYEFIPETVDDARTFICFDVDIVAVHRSKVIYTPIIYVWIFTHKSNLRAEGGGCLIDNISIYVNRILDKSRYYGLGELDFDSARRFVPITDYLGRVLTYQAKDFRSTYKGCAPCNCKSDK